MRRLDPPDFDARATYRICVSTARPLLRARLEKFEDAVAEAGDEYREAAEKQALHGLSALAGRPGGYLDRKALAKVYTARMARENAPGRPVYDAIKRGAEDRCPLCGQGRVETLDHHLPKGKYPLLGVVPVNLVPACRDCNIGKSQAAPAAAGDQTLHPYFDDFSHHPWLSSRVRRPRGHERMSMVFFVSAHPDWDATVVARLRTHLRVYNLNERYRLQVSTHLAATGNMLRARPVRDVARFLARRAAEWTDDANPNTLESALYRGLAADDWYVNGGWRTKAPFG
ncbi:hypothetical protein [Streptomyces sp. NPDC020141]|uniref:hypothetical protein n=1 Tax=Streptomyces sp. NPDC020141 TaxID=3365065 RepID=UPI0037B6918D